MTQPAPFPGAQLESDKQLFVRTKASDPHGAGERGAWCTIKFTPPPDGCRLGPLLIPEGRHSSGYRLSTPIQIQAWDTHAMRQQLQIGVGKH